MADEADIERETPPEWIKALDRAEADVAAGRVYDGAGVRERLRDSIRRMQADPDAKAAAGR